MSYAIQINKEIASKTCKDITESNMNIPGSTDIIILAGNSHPDLAQKIAG